MKVAEVPFVVLRFQYQIARLPLQLIEDQVAARLRSEGPARLLYERSFGALDATVGKLLGDPQLEKRGAALVERSNALSKAAKIDATATLNRQQADEAAAQRKKAAQAAKRQQEAKIGAAEQRATKAAESKLDDAQAKRSEAASRRAQADRVEELANIEKQKRRSDRVNNS